MSGDATIAAWQQLVREAAAAKRPLRPRGSGSKDFYGGPLTGEIVDTRPYAGVIRYEPTELVVTARCGTPLDELDAALRERGQCLPFEPPRFGGGTVGGMVAAGLSGPGRMAVGGVRDYVLGVRIIDGHGDLLRFGGEVMKNVAGYDVSRVMAGSMGTLGLITEVSLKVLPLPSTCRTTVLEVDRARALRKMNQLAGQAVPVTASAWFAGRLFLRFAGAVPAVAKALETTGGETLTDADAFWDGLREQAHPFFAPALREERALWRVTLPSVVDPALPGDDALIEWGGAQRWCYAEDPSPLRASVAAAGGVAVGFRCTPGDSRGEAIPPRAPAVRAIEQRLKKAFDPAGIFSPERLGAAH